MNLEQNGPMSPVSQERNQASPKGQIEEKDADTDDQQVEGKTSEDASGSEATSSEQIDIDPNSFLSQTETAYIEKQFTTQVDDRITNKLTDLDAYEKQLIITLCQS